MTTYTLDTSLVHRRLLHYQTLAQRYVLHLFSGRRRENDLQFYLNQASLKSGKCIFCLSFDLAIDSKCDLLETHAQALAIWLIKQGVLLAMVMGPPCETWTKARAFELIEAWKAGQGWSWSHELQKPRPLRSAEHLWGMRHTKYREHQQCITRSGLL